MSQDRCIVDGRIFARQVGPIREVAAVGGWHWEVTVVLHYWCQAEVVWAVAVRVCVVLAAVELVGAASLLVTYPCVRHAP